MDYLVPCAPSCAPSKRNCKIIGLSVGPVGNHSRWVNDRTTAGNAPVRAVFFISPDKKIEAMLTYPMTSGRNFDEVLRLVESFQLTAAQPVATPVTWTQGGDVIIVPSVSDGQAREKYPGG
jgi:alkyl hydroperoxide reductase subunit AhpC